MECSALLLVATAVATTVAAVFAWIFKLRSDYNFFNKHRIAGPDPELLWGNWLQLKRNRIEVMEEWIHKYGKVFGIYKAEKPMMVISDVDMIKECFVKNANIFHDRPRVVINVEPIASSLLALQGAEWKNIRASLNPCFSAVKMKTMVRIMNTCTDNTMDVLQGHVDRGEIVDMFKIFQGLTLDVITKCALAWQVECQQNPDDPLLSGVRKLFSEAENVVIRNAVRFRALRRITEWLYPYTRYHRITMQITENVRQAIEKRRKGEAPRMPDMLQLMMDAQVGRDTSAAAEINQTMLIEDRHLLANSFVFLIAGFDTTATTLGFIMHVLAKYPEEQERILDEMTEAFPECTDELTYDEVQSLKRLDMVVSETLRMYPPVVLFVSRICKRETTIMGQLFPEGVDVMVPTWHVHHDPEFWPEPFKFDPERFSEGRNGHHSAAYMPFGLGPRICIGKRFALLEVKIAVCKVIRNYRITQCEETQDPLKFVVPNVIINPENGIKVRLETRLSS